MVFDMLAEQESRTVGRVLPEAEKNMTYVCTEWLELSLAMTWVVSFIRYVVTLSTLKDMTPPALVYANASIPNGDHTFVIHAQSGSLTVFDYVQYTSVRTCMVAIFLAQYIPQVHRSHGLLHIINLHLITNCISFHIFKGSHRRYCGWHGSRSGCSGANCCCPYLSVLSEVQTERALRHGREVYYITS